MKGPNGYILPSPLTSALPLSSLPKGQAAFSFFLRESHQSEAGVPMIPPCRPLTKSELPIGLIQGRRLPRQLSSGARGPFSLRRQRLRPPPHPPPPGLTAPQRGGSDRRGCASRGPRVTPGRLGRRAAEGCQPPGAPLARESS
ncbi:unnamed protein product [Nyctereutes procyonoides]|uniref:(raccoon dog) hypothetical protein n=1 Tax=Nyctereutes procyonoides TaxID=34880 RepID=A0A811YD93_NYCPR|nr:unnamed protein product [Nyctereutes procyonoides]